MPKLCRRRLAGVVALLLADDADRLAPEAAEAADDRLVLAELAVARERHEIGDQALDVIVEVRPPLGARDLRLLPGRERCVESASALAAFASSLAISSARAGESPFPATARSSSSLASISATGVSKLR